MKRLTDSAFLDAVRERLAKFRALPGVRLPLYESQGAVDFGHYLCVVRSTAYWRQTDLPAAIDENAEEQAALAEHIAMCVQDVEELMSLCRRLRLENYLLREWIKGKTIDSIREIA